MTPCLTAMNWGAASMTLLAVVSVGLWTLRVALAARGRRAAAATVAAAEAVVFALVFSKLVADLGSPARITAYAAGVAVGTLAGLVISDRLDAGDAMVEVIVPGDGSELCRAFEQRRWAATAIPATGAVGAATVLLLLVPSAQAREASAVIRATAPDAIWSTRSATAVRTRPAHPATPAVDLRT